ncbi:MAG: Hsp20/alpha crystallin family protein [Muribaculaceae bacterium]|nr:Hsp20/alpha crystallin family protein [Roseburia sp.]MCM1429885.1 Hsp20/alpha crystallin family protein [Muribaculaceae bacterium]MCM1493847.1 Hsp20/alpha crystallin family protein [Muribaculaceae bacterium]
MLMPSLFGDNLLDDFFEMSAAPRLRGFGNSPQNIMHTDVKEVDGGYEIYMNLPGFKKQDVQAELKDGYLTVNAVTASSSDTKDEAGKYIRRERYSGSCSRSFYVGDQVTQEDIKAKFEDGVLKIRVPKYDEKTAVEKKQYIAIEG